MEEVVEVGMLVNSVVVGRGVSVRSWHGCWISKSELEDSLFMYLFKIIYFQDLFWAYI